MLIYLMNMSFDILSVIVLLICVVLYFYVLRLKFKKENNLEEYKKNNEKIK